MFGWSKTRRSATTRAPRSKLLHLGCGRQVHPAWLNVDLAAHDPAVLVHDLREPLPFPDGAFAAVYHSHVLEHLPRREAPRFLAECHRVLEPGGLVRVAVPDLETIARLYLRHLDDATRGDTAAAARCEWLVIELLDQMVRDRPGGEMLRYWSQQPMPAGDFVIERLGEEARRVIEARRGAPPLRDEGAPSPREVAKFRASGEAHQWMYDRLSLGKLLAAAGFVEARVCAAGESAIEGFAACHLEVERDGRVRKPDSLFMEARRPAAP